MIAHPLFSVVNCDNCTGGVLNRQNRADKTAAFCCRSLSHCQAACLHFKSLAGAVHVLLFSDRKSVHFFSRLLGFVIVSDVMILSTRQGFVDTKYALLGNFLGIISTP
jgi:hypothetical protein